MPTEMGTCDAAWLGLASLALLIAGLLAVAPAQADSSADIDRFIAARDQYRRIASEKYNAFNARLKYVEKNLGYWAAQKLCAKPGYCPEPGSLHQQAWLGDLATRLHETIGTIDVAGFDHPGKYTRETLYPETGAGRLDGLTFVLHIRKRTLVVTTRQLLLRWLPEGRAGFDFLKIPLELDDALRSDQFYTAAIDFDKTYYKFSDVPVRMPAGSELAFAMLASSVNDFPLDAPPREVIATLVRHGRVLILTEPAVGVVAIPACDKILQSVESVRHDNAMEEEADRSARACFAAHITEQPHYAQIVAQAQSLIDLVANQ